MNAIEATKPITIRSSAFLIGEGKEEVLCFGALLRHLGIEGIQVEEYGGKSKLPVYLRTLKTRPGFSELRVLGVTRDADTDPAAAFESIRGVVAAAEFPAELRVQPFVLPSSSRLGALEDLFLAPLDGTPHQQCIEQFFGCADRISPRSFETPSIRAKARVHAWLALQERPDLRLGEAAQGGLVSWSSAAFDELKEFIRVLA